MNIESIPASVRARAAAIVSSQAHTPRSPGVIREGQPCLCAAAAIAAASVESRDGVKTAQRFAAQVAQGDNREAVLAEFENSGWSLELCNEIFAANDSLRSEARTDGVYALLMHDT